jgi:NAD(P)-dependent dehydrogenase (short-subunit alcohol dehydrogenase family)
MTRPAAIVVGVGAERGLGAAAARRFAAEGYRVFVAGRTRERLDAVVRSIEAQGGTAVALPTDATREEEVVSLFDRAFKNESPDLVVYNAGSFLRSDLVDLSAADFEKTWRTNCFGGFLVGREAARRLLPLGSGTILFTGASASLRGRPGFAHFAAAKAGLRMVAQSMARAYGPKGLHVAHVIIDGVIDGERIRQAAPQFAESRGPDGLLSPDAIADAYWRIHREPRSAWTHELDLRPFNEEF